MNHPTDTDTPETQAPLEPPADGMTWQWLAWQMRLRGNDFIPPPHLRGLSLAYVEAKAREEGRAEREAKEAKESARRIAEAPKSIERALLDPPSSKKVQSMPAQKGWRLRVRYLNHLRRCRSFREAAARVGIDESTARRWRAKKAEFGARCEEAVAQRHREDADELRLRAGEPRRRPYFFRGKQMGEHVEHDDRALMFLLKLEDAQRARAEAREARAEEQRLQREHEIRLKEMEIAARQEARREAREAEPAPEPTFRPKRLSVAAITEAHYRWKAQEAAEQEAAKREMRASAAHEGDHGDGDSPWSFNDLADEGRDIAPPQIVEATVTRKNEPASLTP
jgi:hypothetical protein